MISPLYNRHLTPLMCKYIEFVVKTQIHLGMKKKCTIQYLVVCYIDVYGNCGDGRASYHKILKIDSVKKTRISTSFKVKRNCIS